MGPKSTKPRAHLHGKDVRTLHPLESDRRFEHIVEILKIYECFAFLTLSMNLPLELVQLILMPLLLQRPRLKKHMGDSFRVLFYGGTMIVVDFLLNC